MHWNYRVIKHKNKVSEWLSLHEVYYNDEGEITMHTTTPVDILVDIEEGREGMIKTVEMILKDLKGKAPILDEKELKKHFKKMRKEGKLDDFLEDH